MAKLLAREDVVKKLRAMQGDRPQYKLAEELGIKQNFLGEIFRGTRNPGDAVLEQLGLEKVVMYREVK